MMRKDKVAENIVANARAQGIEAHTAEQFEIPESVASSSPRWRARARGAREKRARASALLRMSQALGAWGGRPRQAQRGGDAHREAKRAQRAGAARARASGARPTSGGARRRRRGGEAEAAAARLGGGGGGVGGGGARRDGAAGGGGRGAAAAAAEAQAQGARRRSTRRRRRSGRSAEEEAAARRGGERGAASTRWRRRRRTAPTHDAGGGREAATKWRVEVRRRHDGRVSEVHRVMCKGVEWGFQYHNFYGDWELLLDRRSATAAALVHNTMYGGHAHLFHTIDPHYHVPRWVIGPAPGNENGWAFCESDAPTPHEVQATCGSRGTASVARVQVVPVRAQGGRDGRPIDSEDDEFEEVDDGYDDGVQLDLGDQGRRTRPTAAAAAAAAASRSRSTTSLMRC